MPGSYPGRDSVHKFTVVRKPLKARQQASQRGNCGITFEIKMKVSRRYPTGRTNYTAITNARIFRIR